MISVYIHIPFCAKICTYCDFCKVYKNDDWINKYLIALENEIKKNYKNEKVGTLYFGGGTPSCLSIKQLNTLFEIVKIFNLDKDAEITFEINIEDINEDKLKLLKKHVNRISIGVQTFNSKYIKLLGRKTPNIKKIYLAKQYFENINIDLMYGFSGETIADLKKDLDIFLKLNVPHISCYNLILEEHTKLYIDKMIVENDDLLDKYVDNFLSKNGYIHYEISNYAKDDYKSRHNLSYWNNDNYYGFGPGACGYINNIRYENTRSLTKYFKSQKRINHKLDLNETIQNEFILGFRKIKGINKNNFKEKYNIDIYEIDVVNDLLDRSFLLENKDNIYINPKYIYISNEILVNFLEKLY